MDILRRINYMSPEKVHAVIAEMDQYFTSFECRRFTYGSTTLVGLCGELPVLSIGENVPLRILFPLSFPSHPPIIEVNKTDTMLVNPLTHMRGNAIENSYLQNWNQSSSLVDLVQCLSIEFTEVFPVFDLKCYNDWVFVKSDINAVLRQHPNLIVKWKKADPKEQAQLSLQGSLASHFHTTISLPLSFPRTAPEIHIEMNGEIEQFDTSGWRYPGSSLRETLGFIARDYRRQMFYDSTEFSNWRGHEDNDAQATGISRCERQTRPVPKPRKTRDELTEFIKSNNLSENTEIQLRTNGFTTLKALSSIKEVDLNQLGLNMAELCMLRKGLKDMMQKHNATASTTDEVRPYSADTSSFKDVLCQTFKKRLQSIVVTNEELVLEKEIGQGQCGVVYKGLLKEKGRPFGEPVAVKTISASKLDDEKSAHAIATEIIQMSMLRHKNVLRLRALLFSEDIPSLVLPFMANGSLLDLFKKQQQPLSICRLLRLALDAANGMDYLNGQEIIHCDLAARNCLVDDDGTVKISDFGLARQLMISNHTKLSPDTPIPWKWIAPEILTERKITLQSDLWSYGVLLWEIMMQGKMPYDKIYTKTCLLKKLESGYRMQCSEDTPQSVKEIMLSCWDLDPLKRPSFSDIASQLQKELDGGFVDV